MLVDIVERLSNWKHASFRRDGSTLETMMEAANEITSLREQLEKAKKDGERLVEALGRIIEYWNGDSASAVDAMETCIYIAEEELLSNSIYNTMKGNV